MILKLWLNCGKSYQTSLDFNYVKPYLVMWQFDSTIGLMVWEEVLSCLQKVLSRSDISNHVKTFPVLQCLFLDSRQHWYSWNGVRWEGTFTYKCRWKFYQDLTSGTMSRLHLSSKSLPRVQEDMDLEMVSDGRDHPSKVSVKVSSRSDIRIDVKTPPVLQVSSRS